MNLRNIDIVLNTPFSLLLPILYFNDGFFYFILMLNLVECQRKSHQDQFQILLLLKIKISFTFVLKIVINTKN